MPINTVEFLSVSRWCMELSIVKYIRKLNRKWVETILAKKLLERSTQNMLSGG